MDRPGGRRRRPRGPARAPLPARADHRAQRPGSRLASRDLHVTQCGHCLLATAVRSRSTDGRERHAPAARPPRGAPATPRRRDGRRDPACRPGRPVGGHGLRVEIVTDRISTTSSLSPPGLFRHARRDRVRQPGVRPDLVPAHRGAGRHPCRHRVAGLARRNGPFPDRRGVGARPGLSAGLGRHRARRLRRPVARPGSGPGGRRRRRPPRRADPPAHGRERSASAGRRAHVGCRSTPDLRRESMGRGRRRRRPLRPHGRPRDDAAAAGSRKHDVPRNLRRLAEAHGDVTYVAGDDDVRDALDAMRSMLARRWQGGEGLRLFRSPGLDAFTRDSVAELVMAKLGRVDSLTTGGRRLTVSIVYQVDDRQIGDSTAIDPDYSRFGPGHAAWRSSSSTASRRACARSTCAQATSPTSRARPTTPSAPAR